MYEHRCLENTKELYKTAGKCYHEQKYKAIIEVALVSTPEGCTNNIPMKPNPYVSTKNTSAIKPLRKFTWIFNVKHMTDVSRFGATKENHKAICCVPKLQSAVVIKNKSKGHRGPFLLDSISFSMCAISNCK